MLRTSHHRHRTATRTAALTGTLAGAALLAAGTALLAAPAAATTGPALDGACTDAEGVTVVVDSTALGGGIEAGCAPEGGVTGTEALLAAGFTEARDPSGFICAIEGQPDPCPTEFTGEYWSYWFAEPGAAAWTTYQEGSDTAVTAPGAVEGWRYGDGAAGPDVALPVVAAPAPEEEPVEETAAGGADAAADDAAAGDGVTDATDDAVAGAEPAADGPAVPLLAGLGLLAALAVAAVVVARRRSAPRADDAVPHPAQDAAQDAAGTPQR